MFKPIGCQALFSFSLKRVKTFVRREPENHFVKLERAYLPTGIRNKPSGLEFNYKKTGKTAHLFFGLPNPAYGQEYADALTQVKTLVTQRAPQGWAGDDVLSDQNRREPEKLAPYTPRPQVATTISINYAEYTSFESAEDAYLNRQNSEDQTVIELERVFFCDATSTDALLHFPGYREPLTYVRHS